jgi:hypothetical protein
MDIDVAIVIKFYPLIVWLYIECFISKGSGKFVAHKRLRGKCCQGHLQGMKIQKIRILTLMYPPT